MVKLHHLPNLFLEIPETMCELFALYGIEQNKPPNTRLAIDSYPDKEGPTVAGGSWGASDRRSQGERLRRSSGYGCKRSFRGSRRCGSGLRLLHVSFWEPGNFSKNFGAIRLMQSRQLADLSLVRGRGAVYEYFHLWFFAGRSGCGHELFRPIGGRSAKPANTTSSGYSTALRVAAGLSTL